MVNLPQLFQSDMHYRDARLVSNSKRENSLNPHLSFRLEEHCKWIYCSLLLEMDHVQVCRMKSGHMRSLVIISYFDKFVWAVYGQTGEDVGEERYNS